jgi:hypothetical protein
LTTALAPMVSSRRKVRSPILVIAPSFCWPPVDRCRGVSPNQARRMLGLVFSGTNRMLGRCAAAQMASASAASFF